MKARLRGACFLSLALGCGASAKDGDPRASAALASASAGASNRSASEASAPSGCAGGTLDLDAVLKSNRCLAERSQPSTSRELELVIELAPTAIAPGQLVNATAVIINKGSSPAWLEFEVPQLPDPPQGVLISMLSPTLHRGSDGSDVTTPLAGGPPSCGGTADLVDVKTKYLRVRLEPGGRASMSAAVEAVGVASAATHPRRCATLAPLAPGQYELRASVRLNGDQLLTAKRQLNVAQ